MGDNQTLVERARRLLSARQKVVEKKMVGGLSFMVNGHLCCGVTRAGFMVRVGPIAYDRVLAEPYVQPMAFAGRPLAGFVCVDPEGCQEDTTLDVWIQRGIDFVATLPPKRMAVSHHR